MTADDVGAALTEPASPPVSLLERRYRSWLRLLPADYRQQWQEEMVATFLDAATENEDEDFPDYGHPARDEVTSVIALAVRLRLGGMPTRRSQLWGEAVWLVGLLGLLANAVFGTLRLLSLLVGALFSGWVPPSSPAELWVQEPGWQQLLGQLTGLLWVLAFLLVVTGRRGWGIRLAVIALAPTLLSLLVDLVAAVAAPGDTRVDAVRLTYLALIALPVLAVAVSPTPVPPVAARPWCRALIVGALLAPVLEQLQLRWFPGPLDWPGVEAIALAAAAFWVTWSPARRAWSLALLVAGSAVLLLRLVSLIDYLTYSVVPDQRPVLVWAAALETVLLLAAGVRLAVVLHRPHPVAAG